MTKSIRVRSCATTIATLTLVAPVLAGVGGSAAAAPTTGLSARVRSPSWTALAP